MTSPKLSIVIPTYNRFPHLKKCLDSIFAGFKDYPYEIVIADGGSTDGTLEYLRGLDNIRLIEQGKLTGVVKACNECFKIAKGDFVLSINDDFELIPDVIIKSCKLMTKDKQIGMVGPKTQETKYGNLHNILLWGKPYWIYSPKIYIFRAPVLKEIGYYDENLRTYYQDVDTPLMVLQKGYTIAVTREVGIIHYRLHDQKVNVARAANLDAERDKKEFKYLTDKWKPLQNKIGDYLSKKTPEIRRSLFFKRFSDMMYFAEWLRPYVDNKPAMKIYDWFLDQTVLFRDENYSNLKDYFLIQKYPDEIVSGLNTNKKDL